MASPDGVFSTVEVAILMVCAKKSSWKKRVDSLEKLHDQFGTGYHHAVQRLIELDYVDLVTPESGYLELTIRGSSLIGD